MAGVYKRMQMSPEAWCNTTQIMVEDGGTLKLGIKKLAAIGGDWVIYDDFQLFYLGTAVPSGIKDVETNSQRPVLNGIYNLAGQKVDANYKGIIIKNGKKIMQ